MYPHRITPPLNSASSVMNGPVSIAEEAVRRAHEHWNRVDEEPAALMLGEPGERLPPMDPVVEKPDSDHVPAEVAIMEPIFRFFQLLCENHNRDLQVHKKV